MYDKCKFRELLYDIFIYNLNINDCIWYILSSLIEKENIKREQLSKIMIKTFCFFQYYNNNYRPIYHLENYLLYITSIIHGFNFSYEISQSNEKVEQINIY